MKKNICTNKLSDIDYLKHIIPHHQVAVDISKILFTNIKKNKGYDYKSELLN